MPMEPKLSDELITTNVLKTIRQETTDAYNRLHSIAEDAAFVSLVAQSYPNFLVYRV